MGFRLSWTAVIVIYSDSSGIVHSATVAEVDENGNIVSVYTLGCLQTINEASNLPPGPGAGTAFWNPSVTYQVFTRPTEQNQNGQ